MLVDVKGQHLLGASVSFDLLPLTMTLCVLCCVCVVLCVCCVVLSVLCCVVCVVCCVLCVEKNRSNWVVGRGGQKGYEVRVKGQGQGQLFLLLRFSIKNTI